jgi:hypothetical protein
MPRNRITTELRADSAQLRSEFAKSSKRVGEFRKGISSTTKSLAAFAAGAIGIRAGVGIFSQLSEKFDRVGKLANRFNLPVEEVQKLSVAAELTGTNIEKLTAALTKSTVSGAEAANGIKTYADAFAELGIDVDSFNSANATEKISILSRSFATAKDETQAFAAAYRILGKSGADLIPLLRENADGVERLTGSLGTLSNEEIKSIEAFNDSMTLLKANLQAELGRAFAQDLDAVQESLVAVGQSLVRTSALILEHRSAIATMVKVWAAYKGIKVTVAILSRVGALIKMAVAALASVSAINAETAALGRNTAAQAANTVSKKGGAGATATGLAGALNSKAGALILTRLFPMAAVAAVGGTIGKLLGDSMAEGIEARRFDELDRINDPIDKILATTYEQVQASRSVADADRVRAQIKTDLLNLSRKLEFAATEEEAAAARHAITILKTHQRTQDIVRARNNQLESERKITTELRAQSRSLEDQRFYNETAAAQRKATADREKSRSSATNAEIATIGESFRSKKFDLLPDASKIALFEQELAATFSRVAATGDLSRRLRGENSLPASDFDSEADLLARIKEAELAGDAEEVLNLAKALQKVVELNEKINAIKTERAALTKAESEEASRLAADQQALEKGQSAVRKAQAQELAILKLRANGREAEAVALEREIKLRAEAVRLAETAGITEAKALDFLRKKQALAAQGERLRDGREGGLDNRFDAEGNRKLARDGKRKKIVLIRRDRNGVRIDSRAQAAQAAKAKIKPEIPVSKIDRLIELSQSQVEMWGALQASS